MGDLENTINSPPITQTTKPRCHWQKESSPPRQDIAMSLLCVQSVVPKPSWVQISVLGLQERFSIHTGEELGPGSNLLCMQIR